MTQKDPCDVICDVTRVKNAKERHWMQDCMWGSIILLVLQNELFQFLSYAYNGKGHMADLTSNELHEKYEVWKIRVAGGWLHSESFILLREDRLHDIGSVA